jgi:lipopolysaccharide transport system ATP-binding protein
MISLKVTGLGKAYKHYASRWARLAEWIDPAARPRHRQAWVLRDIDFTVAQGEAFGIVGANGAGKSTLLKIIVGTTRPTIGGVSVTGKVAALLELGLGFHPDFTGRQNVAMAMQMQGHDEELTRRLMPEIEAFADIGEAFDQPVRTYSTGMQMRVAFSAATAARPDILILDEALSVGDAYFQHKSFERIRRFAAQGTTLLIASHDRQAIQGICNRAILLQGGTIAMQGDPETVFDYYNALQADDKSRRILQSGSGDGKARTESGTREARIDSIGIFGADGRPLSVVAVAQPLEVRIAVSVHADLAGLVLGCGIKDRLGQMIFGTNTFLTGQPLSTVRKGEQYLFRVRFDANLGEGSYSVHASLVRENSHLETNYHWIDRGYIFEVINVDKPPFVGLSWNEMRFAIEPGPRAD